MLRASSLGLAFTHGISRCYLLRNTRHLHKQLLHEGRPIPRVPHSHAKEEASMSARTHEGIEVLPGPSPPVPIPPVANEPSNATAPRDDHAGRENATSKQQTGSSHKPTQSSPTARSPKTTKGPWRPEPPRYVLSRYAYRDHKRRLPLYQKLVETEDIEEAWQTYKELLSYRPVHLEQSIPHKYLHAFAALLISRGKRMPPQKTRTQTTFLRLLSVLNTIYYTGGQVRLWEWNSLIECAGRGWRRTRLADYQAALNVYRDMVENRAPGSSFASAAFLPSRDNPRIASKPVTPDIVSYTTLLFIAARTRNPRIMQDAESLLRASGLRPDRITHLVYMRYFAHIGRLGGVRQAMHALLEDGWQLGVDGTNSLIWAYGRNGRTDIAGHIYTILRRNLVPESVDDHDYQRAVRVLDEQESIRIADDVRPDAITYYALIQAYAYHGRLRECLQVFADMMTAPNRVTGTLEDMETRALEPILPDPILPIFRSIFLGFVRHATVPAHAAEDADPMEEPPAWWTLEQLHTLFDDFISLPGCARPKPRTVYWLLVAFAITSGYDRAILRSVWERLEARYGFWWDERVEEVRKKIYAEEFDRAYFERLRTSREQQRAWGA